MDIILKDGDNLRIWLLGKAEFVCDYEEVAFDDGNIRHRRVRRSMTAPDGLNYQPIPAAAGRRRVWSIQIVNLAESSKVEVVHAAAGWNPVRVLAIGDLNLGEALVFSAGRGFDVIPAMMPPSIPHPEDPMRKFPRPQVVGEFRRGVGKAVKQTLVRFPVESVPGAAPNECGCGSPMCKWPGSLHCRRPVRGT